MVAVTFCAVLGPLLVKVAVAVMLLPGVPLAVTLSVVLTSASAVSVRRRRHRVVGQRALGRAGGHPGGPVLHRGGAVGHAVGHHRHRAGAGVQAADHHGLGRAAGQHDGGRHVLRRARAVVGEGGRGRDGAAWRAVGRRAQRRADVGQRGQVRQPPSPCCWPACSRPCWWPPRRSSSAPWWSRWARCRSPPSPCWRRRSGCRSPRSGSRRWAARWWPSRSAPCSGRCW